MIQFADKLWVGDSKDEAGAAVSAILNVAHDLHPTRGWDDAVEYMQAGLVDGPGNPMSAYYAAVLALCGLMDRHDNVLVCDHSGGRAMAVAMMFMNLAHGYANSQTWDELTAILNERIDFGLPTVHEAHRLAFNKINWRLLFGATR